MAKVSEQNYKLAKFGTNHPGALVRAIAVATVAMAVSLVALLQGLSSGAPVVSAAGTAGIILSAGALWTGLEAHRTASSAMTVFEGLYSHVNLALSWRHSLWLNVQLEEHTNMPLVRTRNLASLNVKQVNELFEGYFQTVQTECVWSEPTQTNFRLLDLDTGNSRDFAIATLTKDDLLDFHLQSYKKLETIQAELANDTPTTALNADGVAGQAIEGSNAFGTGSVDPDIADSVFTTNSTELAAPLSLPLHPARRLHQ